MPVPEIQHSSTTARNTLSRLRYGAMHREAERLLVSLTASERLLLYILSAALALSTLFLLASLNDAVSVTVPSRGGELHEGIVGTPRFVNPVLALTQTDADVTKLVFSGLLRATPKGELIPDLAESYTVSEDGTLYTFTLRENSTFHDGTALTVEDVAYTIALIKTPEIRSPRRADWEGVEVSIEDRTITFKLPKPYAPFLENTTLGILSKKIWENIPTDQFAFSPLNTEPNGSGPYRLASVVRNDDAVVTSYELIPFESFSLGAANLSRIVLSFSNDEEILARNFTTGVLGAVGGLSPGLTASTTHADAHTYTAPLPRVFAVFFNETHQPLLADISVRMALSHSIDRGTMIEKVFYGKGVPLQGPIVPGFAGERAHEQTEETFEERVAAARTLLEKGGWKFDTETQTWSKDSKTLRLSIATAESDELAQSAELVAQAWRAIGVPTEVRLYSVTELNTAVIRPRSYDALLFGEVIGKTIDLYAFWHSKERQDPGLNLSQYVNSKADSILTQARTTMDIEKREELLRSFAEIIKEDVPAAFLFAPTFSYAILSDINGVVLGRIGDSSDRFLNVHEWYTDTERVWSIFAPSVPLN